ncbi:hypothetical protein [Leminorella grimontii]|uniref:hypothetical protein n=1 Tax=Leminorella grimontii TaxID=82981 RepID=UPI00321FEF0B
MNSIKRYTPDYCMSIGHEAVLMRESDSGEYVKHEDYVALLNKTNTLSEFESHVDHLLNKNSDDGEAIHKLSFTLGLIMGFTNKGDN